MRCKWKNIQQSTVTLSHWTVSETCNLNIAEPVLHISLFAELTNYPSINGTCQYGQFYCDFFMDFYYPCWCWSCVWKQCSSLSGFNFDTLSLLTGEMTFGKKNEHFCVVHGTIQTTTIPFFSEIRPHGVHQTSSDYCSL